MAHRHHPHHTGGQLSRRARACAGLLVACVAGILPTGALASGGGSSTSHVTREASSSTMIIVAILIVLLSAVFEKLQHHLLHTASKDTRAVIHSLFQELTAMGFISVLLFLGQSLTFLDHLSEVIFGEDEAGFLGEVFHQADYVLFLVMLLYLTTNVVLIRVASRQEMWWKTAELEVRFRGGLMRKQTEAEFRQLLQQKPRLCERIFQSRVFSEMHEHELNVYDALRERFVNPDSVDHSNISLEASSQVNTIVLDPRNADLYRKKFTVYAFASRDPVRFEKHWGSSEGQRGDMVVVGLEGDLYVCPQALFATTYEPVVGTPNQYRKTGTVLAKKMHTDFTVSTSAGIQRGVAGSYLVQDSKTGQQYIITGVEFEQNYEVVQTSQATKAVGLPKDFDFAQYLGVCQGHLLRQIVEVSLPTWGVAALLLILQWAQMMIWPQVQGLTMYSSLVLSMILVFIMFLVRRKLIRIRNMLLPARLLTPEDIAQQQRRARQAEQAAKKKPVVAPLMVLDRLGSGVSSNDSPRTIGTPRDIIVPGSARGVESPPTSARQQAPPSARNSAAVQPEPTSARKSTAASSAPQSARQPGSARDSAPPASARQSAVAFTARRSTAAAVESKALPDSADSIPNPMAVPDAADAYGPAAVVPPLPIASVLPEPLDGVVEDVDHADQHPVGVPAGQGATMTATSTAVSSGSSAVVVRISTEDESKPRYLSRHLGVSKLGEWISRRESNLHERLFWLDAAGPAVLMEFVRCSLLVNSLYLGATLALNVMPACSHAFDGLCVGSIFSMVLPPLVTAAFVPSIMGLLTVVSNVEMLKKNKIIGDVLRRQRASRSMRALKLVSALRIAASKRQLFSPTSARRDKTGGSTDAVLPMSPGRPLVGSMLSKTGRAGSVLIQGAAERIYGKPTTALYRKRQSELQQVFRLFDRENTGTVNVQNLESLMHLLGLADEAQEAAQRIVKELDADNSGTVEFREFFDWMALHERDDIAPHDVSDALFDMIDRDGSGDISAAELRDCLLSLGEAMSQEDVLMIVREADANGSGTIDRREFAELMERYLKSDR